MGASEDKEVPSIMQENKIKDALRRISDGLSDEMKFGWVVHVNYID